MSTSIPQLPIKQIFKAQHELNQELDATNELLTKFFKELFGDLNISSHHKEKEEIILLPYTFVDSSEMFFDLEIKTPGFTFFKIRCQLTQNSNEVPITILSISMRKGLYWNKKRHLWSYISGDYISNITSTDFLNGLEPKISLILSADPTDLKFTVVTLPNDEDPLYTIKRILYHFNLLSPQNPHHYPNDHA